MGSSSEVTAGHIGSVVVPEEADGFLVEHPRLVGDLHRTGRGVGATTVTSADTGAIRTTDTRFGFPTLGTLELASGYVGVGVVTHDVQPLRCNASTGAVGDGLVFAECVSVAVSLPAGSVVRTISAPIDQLGETADRLGVALDRPEAGVARGRPMAALRRAADSHYRSVHDRGHTADHDDAILDALVDLFAVRAPDRARRRGAESRRIVSTVVESLDARGEWTSSTLSMCRVAHVSERRLQLAFRDLFGVSPKTYLRTRALSACRTVLLGADPTTTVSSVAFDHGFHHLPRFASAYRATFGELPSETMRQGRGSALDECHDAVVVPDPDHPAR